MTTPDPMPVQQTADWVAARRAMEYEEPEPFMRDPLAALLVPAGARAVIVGMHGMGISTSAAVIRGRLGDEAVLRAVAEGGRQVVSLGAGSDTRAFRLNLPAELAYFELDLPGQLLAKSRRLEAFPPRCHYTIVEADLTEDWVPALAAAGFRAELPTLWIVEGLLHHLPLPMCDWVLAGLSGASAPGSRFIGDAFDTEFLTCPDNAPVVELVRSMGRSLTAIDDPVAWLAGHGWSAEAHRADRLGTAGHPLLDEPVPPRLADAQTGLNHLYATFG
ncbi:SAM-dependent methyltransferase [Allokutzneria albata]|uniref:S-adenosyl-L-methionine-dependent methyltransferase n=1 Tax=Allokutzneria albata TaxID=211114 RepID=A0A1G9TWG3_ALLAB|nr:SAM-dependent methyltransferase [Allokutzneria albata]SDM51605.1 Leucine carboxyl methyltransferase [Allokutzneria albata]